MSTTVDERVVSMKFDNKQFESNVQTSLGTLDKLKSSLKLDGAAKGFENIDSVSRRINFNPLSAGVETVKAKFSALEVMAVTALANITNSAVNAGKRLVSAFTVEPIKSGLEEYETQINAVQTILANTQSKGTTLDEVNAALDELNTYADKTIYNFTEMTRNIGTFTAAGIDLKTSTSAIQGIANLAAVSGSNAQQASTAMYQLSQALAAGSLKLQDWNSVVNAGMGGQVFQDALKKTAETHGVNVDAMIKKEGSFRESLKEGWITTEILTETLSKMTKSGAAEYLSELTGISQDQITATQEAVASNKDGSASYEELAEKMAETGKVSKEDALEILNMADTAEDAATKVKTFSQLLDTLKEAAQSGWTQTWEILIGDFEEAKELWTGVSDYFSEVINKSAEARNNMLEGWAKGGGREMAIQSFKNAFEGLLSVINPVKEAFREVFPRTTSKQLLEITKRIQEFTKKMKLSEDQQKKLKSAFKGLFSVIDIGVTFIKKFIGGIAELIGHVSGAGDSILDVAGNLGDLLSGFRDNIKESDVFGKAIDKVVGFLKNGIDKVKEFYGILKEKIHFPSMDDFLNLMVSILGVAQKIGSKIGEVFSTIGKKLATVLNFDNLSKGLSLANGGLLTTVLLSLKKAISGGGLGESLSKLLHPIESIKDALTPVTSVLDEVKGCLEAWQNDIKANTLRKIATAVAILVASLFVLSLIDQDKLTSSLMAITALFGDLILAMDSFNLIDSPSKGAGKTAGIMIAISVGVLILASAVKKLSGLSWEDLAKGLSGTVVLLYVLSECVKDKLSNTKGLVSAGIGMIAFAAGIKILASAVTTLSALSWEELAKGMSSTVILIYTLSACMEKLTHTKGLVSAGIGLIAFATGIKILTSSVIALSSLSWEDLAKGLSGTVVLIYTLSSCMEKLTHTKGLVSAGIALIAFAAGIKILTSSVMVLSSLSWEGLAKGLSSTVIMIYTLSACLEKLTHTKGLVSAGIALIAFAASMKILVSAIQSMASMSWMEIAKGLSALAVSLYGLVIALNVAKGTLSGAAALLVASVALSVLASVLVKLGSLSWGEIAKSLIALAGAIAILAVAALACSVIIPEMLALGAALALMGIGIAAVGAGIALISLGLSTLAVTGAAGATAFVGALMIIVTGLISLIPAIILGIASIITAVCQAIIMCAPAIGLALIALVTTLCQVLVTCVPTIVDAALQLLAALLLAFVDYSPTIVQAGADLIVNLLKGIADNIPNIASAAVDIIGTLLRTIGEQIPEIVNAGVDLMVNLINGLADGLEENAEKVHDAMVNLVQSLIMAFCELLGIHSPSTVFAGFGGNIIEGLINGIKGLISKPIQLIKDLGGKLISAIGDKVSGFLSKGKDLIVGLAKGIKSKASDVKAKVTSVVSGAVNTISSKAGEFLSKGKDLAAKLGNGIKSKLSDVKSKAKSIASGALDAVKDKMSSFADVGKNMMEGLGSGIKNAASKVVDKAKGVVKSALDGAKKLLGIKSPSREFKKIGKYVDEGFVIGLDTYKNRVYNSAMHVGQASIDGVSKAIASISNTIDEGIDSQPTIRPVIDLDDVTNGISSIDDMMSQKRSMAVLANVGSISSMMNKRQNGTNDDVISAINRLGNKLDNVSGNTYTVNGVTYDDGSNISNAVRDLIRATRVERRA